MRLSSLNFVGNICMFVYGTWGREILGGGGMSFGVEVGLWMMSCGGSWRVIGKWYVKIEMDGSVTMLVNIVGIRYVEAFDQSNMIIVWFSLYS